MDRFDVDYVRKQFPALSRTIAGNPVAYLDGLNAAWIRDQGPPFLIFAWERIDGRNP